MCKTSNSAPPFSCCWLLPLSRFWSFLPSGASLTLHGKRQLLLKAYGSLKTVRCPHLQLRPPTVKVALQGTVSAKGKLLTASRDASSEQTLMTVCCLKRQTEKTQESQNNNLRPRAQDDFLTVPFPVSLARSGRSVRTCASVCVCVHGWPSFLSFPLSTNCFPAVIDLHTTVTCLLLLSLSLTSCPKILAETSNT